MQQLLLREHIDALCDQLQVLFARAVSLTILDSCVGVLLESADLVGLPLDDLYEEKKCGSDEPSPSLFELEHQDQMVSGILLRDAHSQLQIPR